MSTHQLRESARVGDRRGPCSNRGKVAFSRPRTPEMVARFPGFLYARYGRGLMDFFRQVMVIAAPKDLRRRACATKEAINGSLAFALVILLLFAFAFDPTGIPPRDLRRPAVDRLRLAPARLILNRSFARELPNDCLDALIAAPISGGRAVPRQGHRQLLFAARRGARLAAVFGIFLHVRWTQRFPELMLDAAARQPGRSRARTMTSRRSPSTSVCAKSCCPCSLIQFWFRR